MTGISAEARRLQASGAGLEDWSAWGTFLPERQWGTVREDSSTGGDAWGNFTYEMAQYRAYRHGEDGLLGWTDRRCRLCFSIAVWNGRDAILKERFFGLSNPEGNHGEDVKELFYYVDATPTHSYAKALYKYPQSAFPYEDLRAENKRRGVEKPEYELIDTGVFEQSRYFDITVEYAKAAPDEVLIRLTFSNRAAEAACIHLLPTLVLRNDSTEESPGRRHTSACLRRESENAVLVSHAELGEYRFELLGQSGDTAPATELLFTDNLTNTARTAPNEGNDQTAFSKDAFDSFVVHDQRASLRQDGRGTKCAFYSKANLPPGETKVVWLRLAPGVNTSTVTSVASAEVLFAQRIADADAFYAAVLPDWLPATQRSIARQAYAGMLWAKQYYEYIGETWQPGYQLQDPAPGKAAQQRMDWRHLYCQDVLSMPDKWEYPWFAAWDLAFHTIPLAEIDPAFAKHQLLLLLRERYQHPNGQIPAYEFSFSDTNPPVHAWAVWRVYFMGRPGDGQPGDLVFLERCFLKLLLNFNWWLNRKDEDGRNLFGGGFLGLDNIGVFDRSQPPPPGVTLEQADGTAWMGFFCSTMLQIALELAEWRSPSYEDIASALCEHYIAVIDAMNTYNGDGLWHEEDGFYYDRLVQQGRAPVPIRVRSIVGLVPLFCITVVHRTTLEKLPAFSSRLQWFLDHKPALREYIRECPGDDGRPGGSYWIALAPEKRFVRVLERALDEAQFLSAYGIRSLSREHLGCPFQIDLHGETLEIHYVPAEGNTGMFGGNSNWRGPVWFPFNALLIHALERYASVYGDRLRLPCGPENNEARTLLETADMLSQRLIAIFEADSKGYRPCHGGAARYAESPHWKDLVLFNEYFSGEDGRGIGASHQTGWTGVVATLIRNRVRPRTA